MVHLPLVEQVNTTAYHSKSVYTYRSYLKGGLVAPRGPDRADISQKES